MTYNSQREATARYNQKTYERLELRVKKGQRKDIQDAARRAGKSVNRYILDLIAKEMGAILNIPVLEILERSRETVPQMKLARAQRLKNVKDAFRCTTPVHGMRIWIIDDVLTTGSTIHACAQALRMQGGLVEAFVMAHTE